jgi:hypothetical protein
MTPIDQLKSVLCDPAGKCCITGSDEDRAIVDRALQALIQQQPVAIVAVDGVGQIQVGWITKPQHNDKLYTSPPPRKPLTYEEITAISKQVAEGGPKDSIDRFVRAIEDAHGIKENT